MEYMITSYLILSLPHVQKMPCIGGAKELRKITKKF